MPKYVIIILVVGGLGGALIAAYFVWDIVSTYYRITSFGGGN